MSQVTPWTAIICYSLTGHTEKLAQRLADSLDARLLRVQSDRYRRGLLGYLRAGYDSLRRSYPPVTADIPDLSDCGTVIFCAPVWAGRPATPIRAVMAGRRDWPARIGLVLTSGSPISGDAPFAQAETDLGRPCDLRANLANTQEGTEAETARLDAFLTRLRANAPDEKSSAA